MRSLIALFVLACCFCSAEAKADLINGLVGSWNSDSVLQQGGQTQKSKGVVSVRILKSNTLYFTSSTRVRGKLQKDSEFWFYKNKTAYVAIYEKGSFVGEGNGSWSVRGPRILLELQIDDLFDSYNWNGSLRRISRNKWAMIATMSGGARSSATLTRR
jgi:hypothetical protein